MIGTDERAREVAYLPPGRSDLAIVDTVHSAQALRQALKRRRAASTLKLGARLLELRLITQEQLNLALYAQHRDTSRHLGEILLDMGVVSKEHLDQVLCEKLGIPLVDLGEFGIDPSVLRLIPPDLARRTGVLPLCRIDGKLVVAVSNPLESECLERIRFLVQTPLVPVMAPRAEIEQALRANYTDIWDTATVVTPLRGEILKVVDRRRSAMNEADLSSLKLVNRIIGDAIAAGASDVHIDGSAGAQHVTVRFRCNGELTEYLRLPAQSRAAIVTRLKAMAGIEVPERRHAQEGRIERIENGPGNLKLRVITVPTRDGNEDIAIKIVPDRELVPLHLTGLREAVTESIKELISAPRGLLLIAGPAASGKTTLAHSILSLFDGSARKIWTAESPVEIVRPDLSQVEVSEKSGWDYPAAVRTIMRADPDVLLIGDIRERETGALAVEAALKGCLVVSTIRANSAAETVGRMLDMGIDAFSLADALLGVLSQRLARRLCVNCRTARRVALADVDALAEEYCAGTRLGPDQVRLEWLQHFGNELLKYESRGCNLCGGTGYRGHIGLHELLPGGAAMRGLIVQRRPAAELLAAAMQRGMRTLKQDGIEKTLAGDCDLRDVRASTV